MPVTSTDLAHGLRLVQPSGRLDASVQPELSGVLQALIAERPAGIIIDLSAVNYISSSGLKTIVSAWREQRRNGGNLVLCGLGPRLREIFEMVGFTQILGIFDTVADAETFLRSASEQPASG